MTLVSAADSHGNIQRSPSAGTIRLPSHSLGNAKSEILAQSTGL
jgi:hypothetical protein